MHISKPLLTISLLASNRPDTIRKCLDSLRPIREAISCELILVDTSKSEQIHSILCEYTDQVYTFEWCNDFAKARNVGLKKASGDWFLFLDDDEWFIDAEGIISFFQTGEYKEYGYANYIVRNYMDIHYSTYSDGYVTRMIRLEENTEFKSKIHEYLFPICGKRKDIEALVGHSGYIYEAEEKKRAHFERNYNLLLEMIQEEPENVRWKMQMAQELCSTEHMKELTEYCKEQIENKDVLLGVQYDSEYGNVALGTFYVGYVKGLLGQENYKDALRVCTEAIEHPQNTKVLKALMLFYIAECNYHLEHYERAKEKMTEYLSLAESLSQDSALMRIHKMVALVAEAFDEVYLRGAHQRLICAGLKLGSTESLARDYHWLGLENKVAVIDEETLSTIIEALENQNDEVLVRFVEDAYQNNGLEKALSAELFAKEKQDKPEFENAMRTLAKANVNHADVYFAKAYINEGETALELYNRRRCALSAITEDVKGREYQDVTRVFNDYMVAELEFYLHILGEDNFESMLETLPKEAQGAAWLNVMFGREENDIEFRIADLKQCGLCMPELAENIKYYAGLLAQQANVNEEMMQLVSVMKGKIVFLIQQGMKQEAKAILRQVRQLVPQDKELEILEQEIDNE